jgi:hypothetical protein
VVAAVDLDEHLEALDGPPEESGCLGRLDADPERHPVGECAQSTGSRPRGDYRIGEEEIVEPGGGEALRLRDGGYREPGA